jgi:hypothetical protein
LSLWVTLRALSSMEGVVVGEGSSRDARRRGGSRNGGE